MSPAVVSTASPSPIGATRSLSPWTAGPPAREIAPATPPPWRSSVLAALAIASTSSLVMSACATSISGTPRLSPIQGSRVRGRGYLRRVADVEPDQALLTALTTEHFGLAGARAQTTGESSARASLYISSVTSTLVALGFIGQTSDHDC